MSDVSLIEPAVFFFLAILFLAMRALAREMKTTLGADEVSYFFAGWFGEWIATAFVFLAAVRLAKWAWALAF